MEEPAMRHQMPIPEITLSKSEYHELLVLSMSGGRAAATAADDLFYKLERVRIVSDDKLPSDVVRMGSLVTYRPDHGEPREVTLVYPVAADISRGTISVLTPVGTALLGLHEGQSTTWRARDGREHSLRVESVRQPELVA
jgi:regulator of nucleoside diphosphate kinase